MMAALPSETVFRSRASSIRGCVMKADFLDLDAFRGVSPAAAAEVPGISPTTADRWWAWARARLRTELSAEKNP